MTFNYYIDISAYDLQQMMDTSVVTKRRIVIDLNANEQDLYFLEKKFKLDLNIFSKLMSVLRRVNFETQVVYDKSIIINIKSDNLLPNFKTSNNETVCRLYYFASILRFLMSSYSCKEQFRFLVNSIRTSEIDRVIILSKADMLKYKFIDFYKDIKDICLFEKFRKKDVKVVYPVYKTVELMGCYIDMRKNRLDYMEYFNDIGEKIEDNENNIVCLCEDNIKLVLKELKDEKKKVNCCFEEFKEIVYMHELGHLVFSYTNSLDRDVQEKQANYFASLALEGKYDFEIKEITKIQPLEYHNPLLVSNRIKDPIKYEEQVEGLYEGKVVK